VNVHRHQRAHRTPASRIYHAPGVCVPRVSEVLLKQIHIDIEMIVAVEQDRLRAAVANGVGRRDERHCGDNHRVPGAHAGEFERDVESRRSASAGNRMGRPSEPADRLLEARHVLAGRRDPAGVQAVLT